MGIQSTNSHLHNIKPGLISDFKYLFAVSTLSDLLNDKLA